MSEPPHLMPRKNNERAAREERLAKALRVNLLRRKEQRRAARLKGSDKKREPPA
jgi:hypothetical protein